MTDTSILYKVYHILYKVYRFYIDGFRSMTVGRVLWTVILIKLVVTFPVLTLFLLHEALKLQAPAGDRAGSVARELIER